jgi:enoyl-CoA hydratase
MVLSAGIYTAEQMQDWGLVNRIVSPDRLQPEGREFANTLALGPPLAHQATKRILRTWRSEGVAGADRIMCTEGTAVILSTDLQDGVASLTRSGRGHADFTGN